MEAQIDQSDELGWLLDLAMRDRRRVKNACPKAVARAHRRLIAERAELTRLREENERLRSVAEAARALLDDDDDSGYFVDKLRLAISALDSGGHR